MKEKVISILAAHDSIRGAEERKNFGAYLLDVFTKAEESAKKVAEQASQFSAQASQISALTSRVAALEPKR